MELKDMITRRKSVRKYAETPVGEDILQALEAFLATAKPLDPTIKLCHRVVDKEQVRFYFPWKAPKLLAIYSEEKPGYLENVGFLYQQADLFLQSKGLGSCWMGLGKVRADDPPEGMTFVILLAFGWPDEPFRQGPGDFKRNAEIADRPDEALEPARLAPSSTNSQPWYFVHGERSIRVYCSQRGLLKHTMLGTMNRIDMGIALAHLYVAHPNFCHFTEEAPDLKGYRYTCSITL